MSESISTSKWTKKLLFVIYGLIAAGIPYLCRLFIWFIKGRNTDFDFYQNELDLFLFSLAVGIALFAEIKNHQSNAIDKEVIYALSSFYFLMLGGLIIFSLLNEFEIIKAEMWHVNCIENCKQEDEKMVTDKAELYDTKFSLFVVGILFSISSILISYKAVLSKKSWL